MPDDLLQEPYLRLLRARENGPIRCVKALLFAIARNKPLPPENKSCQLTRSPRPTAPFPSHEFRAPSRRPQPNPPSSRNQFIFHHLTPIPPCPSP